jgi:LysM repeat protein
VVVAGDTLSSLATTYGVAVAAIVEANKLTDRTLKPGQRLIIPGAKRPPTDKKPTEPEKKP